MEAIRGEAFVMFSIHFRVTGYVTTSPKTFAQAYRSRDELPIRVTTTVLSQQYCKEPSSDVSDNLRMKLRLRYTNVGTQPLILYKHENTVFREMISRDPSAAAASF